MQSNRFLLDGSIKLDLGVHLCCHLVVAYRFYNPDMVVLIYGTYIYRMITTLPVQDMDTVKDMASLKTSFTIRLIASKTNPSMTFAECKSLKYK